jgi:hypothetical protein
MTTSTFSRRAHTPGAPGLARTIACLLIAGVPASQAARALVGWGDNEFGQTAVPSQVTTAVALAAGKKHSLALLPDGTVVAWGAGVTDRGVPPDWGQSAPVGQGALVDVAAGAYQSLALRRDGSVLAWGRGLPGDGLTQVAAIAGGDGHTVALFRDGQVAVWGTNVASRLPVPYDCREVVAVAAGDDHVVALRADGTVLAWGANSAGQCEVPSDLGQAVAVAAGASHSLALRADGTVVAWGLDDAGQCRPPPELSGVVVVEIAAGSRHSLARTAHGGGGRLGQQCPGTVHRPLRPYERRSDRRRRGSLPRPATIDSRAFLGCPPDPSRRAR